MLPRTLISELYERYKIDFDMFDYTADEYFALGRDQEEKLLQ